MIMSEGDRWICLNPACGREIIVLQTVGTDVRTNPKCTCGFPMKKPYSVPEFRTIHPDDVNRFQEKFSLKTR
jgi:hypothetical protein